MQVTLRAPGGDQLAGRGSGVDSGERAGRWTVGPCNHSHALTVPLHVSLPSRAGCLQPIGVLLPASSHTAFILHRPLIGGWRNNDGRERADDGIAHEVRLLRPR